ncbi:hypothetical protein Pmani_025892 [Petrolisthes manimaculis]|uniref:Uncharacterized protein n=1 Tax=Petrolisthes manimaculis TaxID=1843537 RepID=A0AAE1P713_9EUCA|nr:hypothetical protein Pmani_025892 [Petrolisthes manimaculis]
MRSGHTDLRTQQGEANLEQPKQTQSSEPGPLDTPTRVNLAWNNFHRELRWRNVMKKINLECGGANEYGDVIVCAAVARPSGITRARPMTQGDAMDLVVVVVSGDSGYTHTHHPVDLPSLYPPTHQAHTV